MCGAANTVEVRSGPASLHRGGGGPGLELEDDGSHPRHILHCLGRLGIEVTQFRHPVKNKNSKH